MSVQISGVLKDGAGKPVPGCSIRLNAKKTSPTVVVAVISSTVTDANGHYSIEAEPGYYIVSLVREGFPPILAGDIYVAPTDAPDTLNAFLDAPKDADLRPEVMKRFEEMVNRVVDLSGATEKDRERAEQAAQSAAQSHDAADVSARSADDNARQTAQDVLASAANADSAAKSAQAATEQAGVAKTSADTAQKAQHEAGASAQSATGSAESAASSAQTAGEHAGNAASSETIATQQAGKAATSATNAANSASAANTAKTGSEAARDAALDAQTAAELAEANAKISETNAAESKRLAEAARDAANSSAGIYQDTTSGLAGTATGGYFSVPSPLDDEVLILYRNDAGIATEVKRYPSAAVVENTRVSMIGVAASLVLTQSIIAAHHAFL